jgi:hypothetical protein
MGAFLFAQRSWQTQPVEETGVAPIRGKTIRIARALLVTAGSEGSNRKRTAHSASKPDSALREGERAKYRQVRQPASVSYITKWCCREFDRNCGGLVYFVQVKHIGLSDCYKWHILFAFEMFLIILRSQTVIVLICLCFSSGSFSLIWYG